MVFLFNSGVIVVGASSVSMETTSTLAFKNHPAFLFNSPENKYSGYEGISGVRGGIRYHGTYMFRTVVIRMVSDVIVDGVAAS